MWNILLRRIFIWAVFLHWFIRLQKSKVHFSLVSAYSRASLYVGQYSIVKCKWRLHTNPLKIIYHGLAVIMLHSCRRRWPVKKFKNEQKVQISIKWENIRIMSNDEWMTVFEERLKNMIFFCEKQNMSEQNWYLERPKWRWH